MPKDPYPAIGPESADAQHSPWERFGWVMGVIWLVFLFFPITSLLSAPLSGVATTAALGCIAAFAVIYVWGFVRLYRPTQTGSAGPMASAILVVLVVLAVAVGLLAGIGALGMVSYLVAYSMFSQSTRVAYALAAFWLLLTAVLLLVTGTFAHFWFFLLIVLLVAVVTGMVRWIDDRQDQHLRTRQELDLVAERERVARDVHDVLGHSLTVITMKSQLAERLVDVDPQAAKAELAQIQSMTRESLAEIRATVAGLRVARLGDELQNARAALHDAGIEAEVPTDPEAVDPRHRLVLAWVLREAVTNVVRHSRATRCTITLAPHGLVVVDDGVGPGAAACLAPESPGPGDASPGGSTPGGPGAGGTPASATALGSRELGSSDTVGSTSDRSDSDGSAPGSTPLAGQAAPGLSRSGAPAADVPRTDPPRTGNGPGHGIRGARERVEASGGTLTVTSPPGGGTHVEVQW